MQSNSKSVESHDRASSSQPSNGSQVWLSLATAPVLLALAGGRAINTFLLDISRATEEIFRGDRLPILPLPDASIEKSEMPPKTSPEN